MIIQYLSISVALHDDPKGEEIQPSKYDLTSEYIHAVTCDGVKQPVNVDMEPGIHQRACIPFDGGVVSFTFNVHVNLLHVRLPINLRVYRTRLAVFHPTLHNRH